MEALKFINDEMEALDIFYEYGEWGADVVYPYFVGEFTEEPTTTEDGAEQSTLMLTGFNRGSFLDLLTIKEKIKEHFNPIYGLRAKLDGGAIAVFFDSSFFIPSGEAELKKIQINLTIKEWKGA